MRSCGLFITLVIALIGAAFASDSRQDSSLAGRYTEVLVVGTPHLTELQGSVDHAAADVVIEHMHSFSPDAIAVECIAPEVLGDMEQRGGFYAEIAEMFAGRYLAPAGACKNRCD